MNRLGAVLVILLFVSICGGCSRHTTVINVTAFGATGNGSTNDTAAINNAIAALTPGATLLFPCGTYLITSQLSLSTSSPSVPPR